MSTLRLRNLATLSMEKQLKYEINFDMVIEQCANKKGRSYFVENCSFLFRNKDGPNFYKLVLLFFLIYHFCFLYLQCLRFLVCI